MKLDTIEKKIIKKRIIELMNNSKGNPNSEWPEGDTIKRIWYSKMFRTNGYYCISFTTHIENTVNDIYININEFNSEVTSLVRDIKLKSLLS